MATCEFTDDRTNQQCNSEADFRAVFEATPTEIDCCKPHLETIPTKYVVKLEILGEL